MAVKSDYKVNPKTVIEHIATGKSMTKEEITSEILNIFQREFEMESPGLDDDLRSAGEFDSVDAIELLLEIERFLNTELTHEEKQMAMEIRTIRQVIDYVWLVAGSRGLHEGS